MYLYVYTGSRCDCSLFMLLEILQQWCFSSAGSDQEAVYQRYLRKQTEELEQLQQERQRLLEVQKELARMSQHSEPHKTVATQVQCVHIII